MLLDNQSRMMRDEKNRLKNDVDTFKEKVKENQEKVKLNNQLPYLVGNVVEVLDIEPEEENEEDGMAVDLDSQRKGKCCCSEDQPRGRQYSFPLLALLMQRRLSQEISWG
eukprot:jgi/Botrbrau1/19924/Bobra.0059s0041.1